MTPSQPKIDLLDPATFGDGHPKALYQWLHDHDPVHWHAEPDGPGFWVATRHEDVQRIGRDHATFSSEPTIMIADPSSGPDSASLSDHKMMLMCDPPDHTRLRRLISSDFTPRSARALGDRIAGLARGIVDEVIEAGECDLVSDLAGEMPSYVIADLLGVPLDDGRKLYELTELLHSSDEAVSREARAQAFRDMFTYAADVFQQRSEIPTSDLSSKLVHAQIDGDRLDLIDFSLFFTLLVDAGGDTTRNLIGGGMRELFRGPDQMALLQSDLDRYLPNAIEEMLRHVAPVIYMRRTARADTTLAGRKVSAGDKVVMYYGAANRDRSVFDEPDRFDISRANASEHIAFGGGGPHFCLGANLARLEIEAMFREMLTRLADLQLAGDIAYLPSTFISGPTTMPVVFTPSR